jgi:spore photoproduct lyase
LTFARKSVSPLTFEIGSNSDLVLENTITDNLPWVIEEFAREGKGKLTFPTKFKMVEPLLNLNHQGKTVFRMSVNPEEIIGKIELGTSSLSDRIEALNKMAEADYQVGLLIAPVIMVDDWKEKYTELLDKLEAQLSKKVKETMFIEVIFMTYSYVQRAINSEAFPFAPELYNKEYMIGRGRGKYWYRQNIRDEGEVFLREEIQKRFPDNKIVYFC